MAVIKGFKREVREKIRGFSGDMQIQKLDLNASYQNSPFAVTDTFVTRAKANGLFASIVPYATKPGIIKAHDEIEGVVMKGVDNKYDWSFIKKILVAGRVIDFKDSLESRKQILISQFTANRLRLKLGDDFLMYFVQEPLRKRKFKIVGIFDVGVEEVDKTFVIGDMALIRRLNGWKDNDIGGYELRLKDFDAMEPANNFIGDIIPTTLRSYTVVENFPAIFEWLKLLDINTHVILVLMMLVAVINMISALLIMILERTSMIGILKAMGARNTSIQSVFLLNAVYLIGLGLIFGNVLGLGLGFLQFKTHLFKLDQASYYMSFVPIQIDWVDVALLNLGTLAICLLVLIIPSTLVSRISPVKAIRFK